MKPVQKRGSEAAHSFVVTFANGDDLDWEFAFVRTLGIRPAKPEDLMSTKRKKRVQDLPVLHPDAAGIDVGAYSGASHPLIAGEVIHLLRAKSFTDSDAKHPAIPAGKHPF